MTAAIPVSLQPLPYGADSAHWLQRVRKLGRAVWLDSAWPHCRRGRYDIISAAPLATIEGGAVFDTAQRLLADYFPAPAACELPFSGGLLGLFGYEAGRALHDLPAETRAQPAFPAALAGLYSWAIVVDHRRKATTLALRPETPAELRERIDECLRTEPAPAGAFRLTAGWRDEFPEHDYRRAFARLQEYIRAGDCYQVNLARRFATSFEGDPLAAYLRLREIAAAPFSGYLEYDSGLEYGPGLDHEAGAVLSLSPERFIAAENGALLTQPIKGTARRDADPAIDRELAQALQRSEKDRAENLMIVDLLRNDLGRSCEPGSIRVDSLFELQSFATVHHLVSSVRGTLRDGVQPLAALRQCFPGGSITGAPKLRAMQIIDELEPAARSVFCGAIGYVDAGGGMDTNIAIRTLLACERNLYAWAGGGIVADSQADAELQETAAKIGPLLRALDEKSRQ